jgi:hypothetical protein
MRFLGLALMGLMLGGCGAKKAPASVANGGKVSNRVQDWVNVPPAGCQVGSVAYIPTAAQNARSSSGDLGRNELAKSIKVKIQGMATTYLDTVVDGERVSAEQKLGNAIEGLIKQDLFGARVVRAKQVGKGKEALFHSLVCIDPDALKEALNGMQGVSEAAKAAISARSDEAFKDMRSRIDQLQ